MVELDAVDDIDAQPERIAFLGGDHTRLTDVLDRARDHLTDRLVVAGRQRGDAQQVAATIDRDGVLSQRLQHHRYGPFDTAAQPHRVGARVDRAQPSRTIAWASTVAVVVPSPTTPFVFIATSFTS